MRPFQQNHHSAYSKSLPVVKHVDLHVGKLHIAYFFPSKRQNLHQGTISLIKTHPHI